MLYSTLSNDELERWCSASPTDLLAKAEMLRRVPEIMYERTADLEEAEERAETAEADVADLEAKVASLEAEVLELENQE